MKSTLTSGLERRLMQTPAAGVKFTKRSKRDDKEDAADDGTAPAKDDAKDAADADAEKEEDKEDEEEDKDERDDNSPGTIAGYASVFYNDKDPGTEYCLWEDASSRAVERIATGCFSRAVREEDDVLALVNHDQNRLIGRTTSGTCRVAEDGTGLFYSVDLPDTTDGRDVAEMVGRGDMTGSSFGFITEQDSWRETEDPDTGFRTAVRTIESVRLLDVSPVNNGAYAAASVGPAGRSNPSRVCAIGDVNEARSSYERWKESRKQVVPVGATLAAVRTRVAEAECEMV